MLPTEEKMTILVPQDCAALVAALVRKLGGSVLESVSGEQPHSWAEESAQAAPVAHVSELETGDEIIVVPPPPAYEWPGRMCRGLRCRGNLSREDVARAIGVPPTHIEEYENFTRPIPAEKAADLARILGGHIQDFTHGPVNEE